MNLTDTQKQQVARWIADGAKLADIQKRIASDFGLSLTYMEVRLLVDDLKLVPLDPAPAAVPEKSVLGAGSPAATKPSQPPGALADDDLDAPGADAFPSASGGNVSVTVDTLARPGAMVSGSVKFSDGQSAGWYLDQMGRLGLAPMQQGYRPSPGDLQAFQRVLETELSKIGF